MTNVLKQMKKGNLIVKLKILFFSIIKQTFFRKNKNQYALNTKHMFSGF